MSDSLVGTNYENLDFWEHVIKDVMRNTRMMKRIILIPWMILMVWMIEVAVLFSVQLDALKVSNSISITASS